jgi:hypothetical protein
MAGVYEMLVLKPEENIFLEIPKTKWEDNIKINCKVIR